MDSLSLRFSLRAHVRLSRKKDSAFLFLAAAIFCAAPQVRGAETSSLHWKLLYEENFDRPFDSDAVSWVKDPLGKKSAWRTDYLGDDGEFFLINGGNAFKKQLRTFNIYRKRLSFGKDGWLTVELAARGKTNKGRPERPPSFKTVKLRGVGSVGYMYEPDFEGGVLIRNTRSLPPIYRIEYELVDIDFGGSRHGQWNYDGKVNGYAAKGPKTIHPWSWGPGEFMNKPYDRWPDVRGGNGFYYLAIVDYPDPAPHNNVFIHIHRKVVMDSYNVPDGGFEVCNPSNGTLSKGQDNAVDAFFATPGSQLESKAIMETACGTIYGGENGHSAYVAAAQLVPELMPQKKYHFAVERDSTGYTLELSGFFKFVGQRTFRYHRDFIQDGRPIWHYNQTPQAYDGAFDTVWTYQGPYGHFTVHSWPRGSAYPDSFIIGDPHINYYEGTAAIAHIGLYVPANPGGQDVLKISGSLAGGRR